MKRFGDATLHGTSIFGKSFGTMSPQEIKNRLETAYPGATIEVVDLTGTEDHYEVYVESRIFNGLSRIQQHQHVMGVFGPELKTGEVHALSIKTKIQS